MARRAIRARPNLPSSSSSLHPPLSSLPAFLSSLPVLLFLSFLIMLPGLDVPFLSDDHVLLARVAAASPSGLFTLDGAFFRPLTALLVKAELAVGGARPVVFHVVSAVLIALVAWWVALLARRLRLDRRWFPPLAALLYVLSPAWAESRWWICCQGDLVAALLAVVSMVAFLTWLDFPGRNGLLVGAVAAYLGALLSKEAALTLPLATALLVWGSERWSRRAESGMGALVAVLPFYLVARRAALGSFLAGYGGGVHLSWPLDVVLDSLLQLLWRSLLPAPGSLGFRGWAVPALIVAAGLLGAAFAARRGHGRLLLTLLVAGAVLLLPAVNLGMAWGDAGGTRFLTLPMVGVALALALAAEPFVARGPRWGLAALVVLSVLAWSAARGAAPWVMAGRRGEGEIAGVAAAAAGARQVVVLAPTDSVAGAYVLRNGLAAATGRRLRAPLPSRASIIPLGRAVLAQDGDGPVLRALEDGWHELAFPGTGGYFAPLPLVPPPLLSDVQVRRIEPRRVQVRVNPVPGLVVLAVVRSGVVRVPPVADALHGRDTRDTVPAAASVGRGGPAKEMRDHVRTTGK